MEPPYWGWIILPNLPAVSPFPLPPPLIHNIPASQITARLASSGTCKTRQGNIPQSRSGQFRIPNPHQTITLRRTTLAAHSVKHWTTCRTGTDLVEQVSVSSLVNTIYYQYTLSLKTRLFVFTVHTPYFIYLLIFLNQ